MKISKLFAGLSAMAVAATMAVSASAATTFTFDNPVTEEWQTPMGQDADGQYWYWDAKTFTRDQDLTMTINFEWTEKGISQGYCSLKPAWADGWAGLLTDPDSASLITHDIPSLEDAGQDAPIRYESQGFIQFADQSLKSCTITLKAELVNKMIDLANQPNEFEGITIQIGNNGVKVTSVEFSQDGIDYNMPFSEGGSTTTPGGEDSTPDESTPDESTPDESTPDESTPDESTPDESTPVDDSTPADDSTPVVDDTPADDQQPSGDYVPNTGATVGLALTGLALAGAAVVVAKKK